MRYCSICAEEIGENAEDFDAHMHSKHPELTQPQTLIKKGQNFSKHYATNDNFFHTQYDFRIDILNDREVSPPTPFAPRGIVTLISETQIILNPTGAKLLLTHLEGAIKSFEDRFGPIELPE